ncbi:MAG: polysaccharide biosynthesis/export family protein [bacterium]
MALLPRPTFAALAFGALLAGCNIPQDVGEERQIIRGADAPEATFAVQPVTRDSLPTIKSWPNSHPTPNLGWITHARTSPDPLIEAGDTLDLIIWDNDDSSLLSSPAQKLINMPGMKVSSNGTIFLPYADEVYVAKMTPDEARKAIQDKLLTIIPSAQVQLHFASGANNSVDLVSGVPNPGSYPLVNRSTTLSSILALGGGIPGSMANPQVNLSRGGRLYRVSADTLFSHPNLDTTMRGGDKVFVEADKRYFLSLGAAGREAQVNFPRDTVSALDAMSLIGGVNQTTADPKGILILRNYPNSAVRQDGRGPSKDRMIFAFDLTNADGLFSAGEFAIQDHDLVLVTQSTLVNTKTIFSLVGSIFGLANTADNTATNLTNGP